MVKHLIIKTSFSKLKNGQLKSNLGDLVRSAILLNCVSDKVYWLTDKRAVDILKWFVDIDRIVTFEDGIEEEKFSDKTIIYNIDNYIFDITIYKKLRGKWQGYIWDGKDSVLPANEAIKYIEPYTDNRYNLSWQEALVSGMGFAWNKQDYPAINIRKNKSIDIGLNWHVHTEWESKKWPKENWMHLRDVLSETNSVSWQSSINNFDEYIRWLSSCRVIVTCDTFGLHLASALRKKVVAIIGPTESKEFSYNRVAFIKPASRKCMPCNGLKCITKKHCLNEIDVDMVRDVVLNISNGMAVEK